MGMLRDDELREGYQRVLVSARRLHAQAQGARNSGTVDYSAESEAARNDGYAAAFAWLLGLSPMAPSRSGPAVVTDQTIAAELAAARAKGAADDRQLDETQSADVEAPVRFASGVAAVLAWELDRRGRVAS